MIKKVLLTALVCSLLYTPVFADEDGVECKDVADLSKNIMEARQAGVPLTLIMDLVEKESSGAKDLIKALVISAYKEPNYSSPSMVKKATTEFTNKVYIDCIEAVE